jgi:hypothetical protein
MVRTLPINVYGLLLVCLGLWTSCQKTPADPLPKGQYQEGVLVVNEGSFGNTSGTITHYDGQGNTTDSVFWKANQRDLGDVVQSLVFEGDRGYVVVNNSNKIEVVNANTFTEAAQITGLRLPRYCLPISNTEAYVTEWGLDGRTGSLARIDLSNHTVAERYALSVGPERLALKNGQLYITHVGGFDSNNQVTVFNTQTRQIQTTLTVADKPSGIVEDNNGLLWVGCAGKVVYTTYPQIDTANSTASQLISIDPSTNTIVDRVDYGKGNAIGNLTINQPQSDVLFYTRAGAVWSYTPSSGQERALFQGTYYGLGYESNTQYMYAATSAGVNPATVERRRLDGTLVDDFTAGQFANGFVFR